MEYVECMPPDGKPFQLTAFFALKLHRKHVCFLLYRTEIYQSQSQCEHCSAYLNIDHILQLRLFIRANMQMHIDRKACQTLN